MLVDNSGRVHCYLGNACGYFSEVHGEDADKDVDFDDPEENEDYFSRISRDRARALHIAARERRRAGERTQFVTVVFSYDSKMSTRTRHFGPMTVKEANAAKLQITRRAKKYGLRVKVYTSLGQTIDEIDEYALMRIDRDGKKL